MTYIPPKIGKILRAARTEHKLTQEQAADKIGISHREVMDHENDKRYPKYESLYAWIKAFSIPPAQLFGEEAGDSEAERFLKQLMTCSEDERKIVIETARTLMQSLAVRRSQSVFGFASPSRAALAWAAPTLRPLASLPSQRARLQKKQRESKGLRNIVFIGPFFLRLFLGNGDFYRVRLS